MYATFNLTILAAFMCLCFYSLEEPKPYDTKGIDRLLAEYQPLTFQQRQARTLRDVYEVLDDQEPIAIWGK